MLDDIEDRPQSEEMGKWKGGKIRGYLRYIKVKKRCWTILRLENEEKEKQEYVGSVKEPSSTLSKMKLLRD